MYDKVMAEKRRCEAQARIVALCDAPADEITSQPDQPASPAPPAATLSQTIKEGDMTAPIPQPVAETIVEEAPAPHPPDPFAEEKPGLLPDPQQTQRRDGGPPLSSYVRVGDCVMLLPDVARSLKGVIFEGGLPKRSRVTRISTEERSVHIAARGTVFFRDLDSDWRLVLCHETIYPGDVLENGTIAARVVERRIGAVRLQDATKPDSAEFEVGWAELDEKWWMKERGEAPGVEASQ